MLLKHPNNLKVTGFTLLEMILVLFLLGMLASATLFLTEGVEDQAKYDETKRRVDIIRQAIIGDSKRTINGTPEVTGFAADMKRLPLCLAELLEVGPASTGTPTLYQSPCNSQYIIKLWQQDTGTGVYSGWRGPYIQVSPESNGTIRFRDGYGNRDTDAAVDAINSGWVWNTIHASGATPTIYNTESIKLQSYGSDPNDATTAYPTTPLTLVNKTDWMVNAAVVNLFNTSASSAAPSIPPPSAPDAQLLLRVYIDGSDLIVDGGNTNSTTSHVIASGAIPTLTQVSRMFSFDADQSIPIGTHGFTVICNTADAFDSDCVGTPASSAMQTLTVAPRQIPIIDWLIQE
jgi:prepilin-type N-terminal cleavage/methylation domain-containing protein